MQTGLNNGLDLWLSAILLLGEGLRIPTLPISVHSSVDRMAKEDTWPPAYQTWDPVPVLSSEPAQSAPAAGPGPGLRVPVALLLRCSVASVAGVEL